MKTILQESRNQNKRYYDHKELFLSFISEVKNINSAKLLARLSYYIEAQSETFKTDKLLCDLELL